MPKFAAGFFAGVCTLSNTFASFRDPPYHSLPYNYLGFFDPQVAKRLYW